MIELKEFQALSAKRICDRYTLYASHPDRPWKGNRPRPFCQALSALTGAGKTPILAQTVSLMRGYFPSEPIVLWMSRARSVVGQTYANFIPGGKYSEILDGFTVVAMRNLRPRLIGDHTTPLLVLTTTGLFNNKEQSDGSLYVYKRGGDLFGEQSAWEHLIDREASGKRRPLIVVYDEGHNLSEQQSKILAELEPDAYLLASATLRLPEAFHKTVIQPIRLWVEETADSELFRGVAALDSEGAPSPDMFITTSVSSEHVVAQQLVKRAVHFDGTTAPMHKCLDALVSRLQRIEDEVSARGLGFTPKAIYVCRTNITEDGDRDDVERPFAQREARPILIWRYLVEIKNIEPAKIAIYANLDFAPGTKPGELRLFSKGDNDFEEFSAGEFQHVIFNLSLQEGWDDPACYLAYIDKSMGSTLQVEQVIGRVLRQPGATHYDSELLNSAHFFVRVDQEAVFTDTLEAVRAKLAAEGSAIAISGAFSPAPGPLKEIEAKEGAEVELHHVFVDSDRAQERIAEILEEYPVFKTGDDNLRGRARSVREVIQVDGSESPTGSAWVDDGETNPVRLRWLIANAIKMRSRRAFAVTDLSAAKFDVRVQIGSRADKLVDKLAPEIVSAFYELSDLVYESNAPVEFGPLRVPKGAISFQNSLYDKYGGLNRFESLVASAIDKTGLTWHRNPSNGGFSIPLLSEGTGGAFFPDFVVWKKGLVYCLDTKGGHLLTEAVARKLFDVREDGKPRLMVRFITEGKQTALVQKPVKGGFTVWRMKSGKIDAVHLPDVAKAVTEALR